MCPPKSLQALGAIAGLCLSFFSALTMAAGMVPQTPVVIVDEALGEATLNVKNSDEQPALLYSTIEHIAEDDEPLLLLTPPVARLSRGRASRSGSSCAAPNLWKPNA